MSKKIKVVYDAAPTAGDDTTTEGYTPFDDGSDAEKARSDTQLAEVIRVRLGLDDPPAQPGDTTAPVISSFSATIDPDTLVADLLWQVSDNVAVTGWIVKEDDSTLPASDDSDWEVSEPDTFELSNYNSHTLTVRARDAAVNVSSPVTITIQGEETTGSPPTVDSFSTTNPAADSSVFGFTLDASNATHYKFIYNSNTPPLVGDSGWTAETFASPLSSSATLDSFVDSTVYAYVKDATDVSPALTSFVDVTTAGDTSGSDWLWANDPSTIVAYDGVVSFSGSGSLAINGITSSKGLLDAEEIGRTGNGVDNNNAMLTIAGTYTTVDITNMSILNGRGASILFNGLDGATITIRNNKFGVCNIDGEAANFLQKNALVFEDCDNCTIKIYGNWFNQSDGVMHLNLCNSSSLSVKHNFIDGFQVNTTAATPSWLKGVSFIAGQFGSITGDLTENIIYDSSNVRSGEDIINANALRGTSDVSPFLMTRNRFWKRIGGAAAAFQLGDGAYNSYIYVDENTMIDCNTFGQFSAGHHHKFINNKGYTSELYPAFLYGFAFQVQRNGVDQGKLHDCTLENNTFLHFTDPDTGVLEERGVWFPRWGSDQLRPNHGECISTCDDADNTTPTGFSNNEISHSAWSNGQGKSELWRASWNTFSYAGSNGLTPTISYDSPWIGDGGSQNFTVANATSVDFGDGANSSDIQTHDVISLGIGGVTPYTISSVSAGTNCAVSNNVTGVIWTAGSTDGGAFTYTVTLQDDTGATATGTISGTLASVSATQDYFDQDGADYIAINPLNYDETYERGGYTFVDESVGPYTPDPYVQIRPYTGDVASGDVETDSAERIYRVHFDQDGTYDISIMGLAINNFGQYDELWVGWDNAVETTECKIITDDSTFRWTNAVGSLAVVTGTKAEYDLHVWVKEGGFAIGAIEVYRTVAGSPKVQDATTTPHTESARVAY